MNIQNWFMGVIEDVSDPLGMARVKVRCFGYHTPDRGVLPTKDLPWMSVMLPPTGPGVGGAGGSSSLMQGSMVFGCFYDGNELQDAAILGVFPGGVMTEINYDPVENVGFGSIGGVGRGLPFYSDIYGRNRRSGNVVQSAGGNYYGEQGFYDYGPPTALPAGAVGRLLTVAQSQLQVRATSRHQGPGIAKYWSATSYGSSGYSNREPWCAAFCSWVTKTAGILPDNKLPNTAGAFKFATLWAKRNPDVARLRSSPSQIKAGDFITFSWSHIGIAEKDASGGYVQTIEGNTSVGGVFGVHRRRRALSGVRHVVGIEATGLMPGVGGPDNRDPAAQYASEESINDFIAAGRPNTDAELSAMMAGGQPRSNTGGSGRISLPEGGGIIMGGASLFSDPHKYDRPK